MLHRCYGLVPGARIAEIAGRRLLLSDYPLRQFELNEAAWRLLKRLDGETPLHRLVVAPGAETVRFLEDKVRAGLLRGEYDASPPVQWPTVEVIVPVRDNLEGLKRCLAGLAGLRYPRERYAVTIVDDASAVPLLDELRGIDFDGMTTSWRHLKSNMGPATARNAGAGIFAEPVPEGSGRAAQPSRLLGFVDSDCVPDPDWLETLTAVLDDPLLSAVGGRVDGLRSERLLARYEAACASLYMGGRGGPAGLAEGPVPYLPACNLLVEREAFDAVGGFHDGLRLGEDADFCWRLADAGHGLFYYPGSTVPGGRHPGGGVRHDYRARWLPFLLRKAAYAGSEAWLRRRHPGHTRRRAGWLGAVVLLCAAVALQTRLALVLAPALLLPLAAGMLKVWRKRKVLRAVSFGKALAAGLRAELAALLAGARWAARHTLVLWVPVLVVFPRLLPLAGIVFLMGVMGEWLARRPALGFWTFIAGYAPECVAYSVGRAWGELFAWCRLPRRKSV